MRQTREIAPISGRRKRGLVMGGIAVAALIGTTAFFVKKNSTSEPDKKPEAAEVERRPIHEPFPSFNLPQLDAGEAAVAKDGGASDGDAKAQKTLEEACRELWYADQASDGAVYNAIGNVARLISPELPREVFLDPSKIAEGCRFTQEQLQRVLASAVKRGDARVADLVHELIREYCRGEEEKALIDESRRLRKDFDECMKLPIDSEKSACERPILQDARTKCKMDDSECLAPFNDAIAKCEVLSKVSPRIECHRQKQQERDDAPKFTAEKCATHEAERLGLDFETVKSGSASENANQLATLRLAFLNPSVEPSDEDLTAYLMALRTIVMANNDTSIFAKLGVKDEDEFKKTYMDEVAAVLKKHGGHSENTADKFATLWTLRDVLKH